MPLCTWIVWGDDHMLQVFIDVQNWSKYQNYLESNKSLDWRIFDANIIITESSLSFSLGKDSREDI